MKKIPRIAIVIDMSWSLKRHLEVFDGINRYATQVGWETDLIPLSERKLNSRTEWPFDGIVGRLGKPLVEQARKSRLPVVNVWFNSSAEDVPGVYPDWNTAGEMAAEHLLARGFRRFVYFGFQRDRGVDCQVAGFRSTLQEAGFDCECHFIGQKFVESLNNWEKFSHRLSELTGSLKTPVGLCVSDDLLGRFVLDACVRAGHQVPHDVAVLSMNNEPLICESSSPSLSSLEIGYPQIGWRAAEMLDKLMRGTKISQQQILHPPEALVLRQSTDAFAVEDPLVAEALRFIASQSHRPMTVDDVVREVSTSRRTLERRFQEILGRTIATEVTRMRLERIKRLLLENDESVKTIAYRNGFRDASHLCTVFRRECGMTPGEYRIENGRR